MIKLGGNQKHLAELAPRFPFLETIGQNWQPLRKKGEGQALPIGQGHKI
jgi:hypothetical protein